MAEIPDDDDGDDFGLIRPSLIRLLKNVLSQYPDNGQIIKEIIQNAEDAGASVVKFVYDENEEETLFSQGIAELQGPALYSYNDAYFTEPDWEGIRMLGESLKTKDPMKVGKFGLGFKSVFHLTDNPVIMSDHKLGIINPVENLFSSGGKSFSFGKGGQGNLSRHRDRSGMFRDVFNMNLQTGTCMGTVFRFSLRQKPSKLSETIYDKARITELFKKSRDEGHLALIFLKNIAKIEFYVRKKGSSYAELQASFAVQQEGDDLRQRERKFMGEVRKAHESGISKEFSLITNVRIQSNVDGAGITEDQYFILNYYAGDKLVEERELTTIEQAKKLGFIPLVGMAYKVSRSKSTSGHVFCALPLPILQRKITGLPVHVNGFFALAADRKDLKWSAVGETNSNDKDVSWNLFLIRKVLPKAYEKLFLHLRDANLPADQVYSALADIVEVDSKWRMLAKEALSAIFTNRCIRVNTLGKWVSISEAYFKDEKRSGSTVAESFLARCSFPVAILPDHIHCAMQKLGFTLTPFSPSILRNAVSRQPSMLSHLSHAEKIDLLDYMLEVPGDINQLHNAPVLPLEDGTFVRPHSPGYGAGKIFLTSIEHHKGLVPGCESSLIKTGINNDLLKRMKAIANKGLCQIQMLNEGNVASLIRTVVRPQDFSARWKYSSGELRQFPAPWFQLIWGYINKHDILKQFEGLPLIPMGTAMRFKEVAVIRQPSLFIYHPENAKDEVLSFLTTLGFTVIKNLPSYILQNRSVFERYIYEYKDENIPSLLLNLSSEIGEKNLVRKFTDIRNNNAKLNLSLKLARVSLTSKMCNLITALPMNENTMNEQLVSVNSCCYVAPQQLPSTMPHKMLLKANDEFHSQFFRKLGCGMLSRVELIRDVILPVIEGKNVLDSSDDSMIEYIFAAIKNNEGNYQGIIQRLKSVKFVASDDGKRHMASDLFDPRERLGDLFSEETGRFPRGMFAQTNGDQDVLRMLGLKRRAHVSANDVKQCLERLCAITNINKAQLKARHILEFLEDNQALLADQALLAVMQSRPWVPSQANLVGCVKAIFDDKFESFAAIKILKKSSTIEPQTVINQLSHVVKEYSEKDKHVFSIVLNNVYQYLMDHQTELTHQQTVYLKTNKWVLIDGEFVKPQQIVLESTLDLRPHMYNLTQDLAFMTDILSYHGAVSEITKQRLIDVLYDIKGLHETQSQDVRIVEQDRKVCQEILENLCQVKLSEEDHKRIIVPIHCESTELKFVPSSEAVYSAYVDNDEVDEGVFFIHECITEETARVLHIRSLKTKKIGAEDLGMFEEYGQSEPLTRRINRILTDYGDGSAIFKELIQNADDACATEVKFLYDERLNKDRRKHLIHRCMSDFQGPALWAYNDATFSKEDFENIVKISGATKEEKRDKIGKFGLGFNAVYNITDVPSFVSDNQLVIFDPHTTNLADAITNKSKPGVKIRLGPERDHLKQCRDQLRIYDGIFGMDASLKDGFKMFEGTLFRFPLRTKRQAQLSEIKNLFYSNKEMKELLRKFSSEANRILMFTQNVSKIEFFHLEKEAKSTTLIQPLLQVSKSTFNFDPRSKFLRSSICRSFDIMRKSSQIVDCRSQRKNNQQKLECSIHHVIDIVANVEPKGREEFKMAINAGKETWAVHSFIGGKECMDMAMHNSQLNPVASVAVHISNGQEDKEWILQGRREGFFFSFLPLPIPNGLGVHVNSTFALTKDRKSMQEKSQDDKRLDTLETIWNGRLMKGPVPSAYVGVLTDLTSIIQAENEKDWYSIWPKMSAVNSCSYNRELIVNFYRQVIMNRVTIFPDPCNKRGWLNWSEIKIIEEGVEDLQVRNIIEDVFALFCQDQTIVHMPPELVSTITDAGYQEELTAISLTFPEFFTEVFMPNIKDGLLKVAVRDSIMLYALREFNQDSAIAESISTNDCIPTKPHHLLKKPSDLVGPESKAADLFEVDDEVFPADKFGNCLQMLSELGMISNCIKWDLLEARAKTVKNLAVRKPQVALKRTKKILHLVRRKLENENIQNPAPRTSWKDIEFLPVKPKPRGWSCLEWEGEKSVSQFACGNNMYQSRLENVVGCHKLVIEEASIGHMNSDIEKLLGLRHTATIPDVMIQTEVISESITRCANQHSSTEDHQSELRQLLQIVFRSIYYHLHLQIAADSKLKEEVAKGFAGKSVILTNENILMKSTQVAFNLGYDAKPYLYKPHKNFAILHRDVLTVLGVKEDFGAKDYKDALINLEKDAGGQPLTDTQLRLVRALLESINEDQETKAEECRVVLPDQDRVLRPKSEVVVKEKVWMQKVLGKNYLHESIPPHLALDLGAKTAISHSIASQSRGLPFGQHEKLTVRLKRILEAYPSEIQILYELLQNADDAGASQVKFVLDKRTHPCERVFGDSWEPLQGPALLVFNDAPFTQSDIEGIQSLGEGSKSYDSMKTGQFGIGFNVVYHVTDVPCLLTRADGDDLMCVFDPHGRYLAECSLDEPGRMFEDSRNYLKKTFPDIYNTFLPNVFTNQDSAIFRLPLRTDAEKSKIKEKVTKVQDIIKLFDSFKLGGPEAIIFLRNVTSVQLHVIDEGGNQECIFTVEASMSKKAKRTSSLLNKDCNLLSKTIKDGSESKEHFGCFQYKLQLNSKGKDVQNWRIIQKCAPVNTGDLPGSVSRQYETGELPLIPVGGIAYKRDGNQVEGKVYCLLPLAVSSSLPIHINGKFILDYESRRRLWYTKEDSCFQKDWNYYIIEKCIIPCYIELLKTLVTEIRIPTGTKEDFKKLFDEVFGKEGNQPKEIYSYFKSFPKLLSNQRVHEYDADLIKMFYKKLTEESVKVMPVLRFASNNIQVEFCPPNSEAQPFYLPPNFSSQTISMQTKSPKICLALTNIGMNIYNVPADIVQSFCDSGVPLQNLTPKIVADFLRINSSKILKGRPSLCLNKSVFKKISTVDALIQFCMKDDEFQLGGLPLLVTEDEHLRVFNDEQHVYYDSLSGLFPLKKNLTLHQELWAPFWKYKDEGSGPLRKFTLRDFAEIMDEELSFRFKESEEIDITNPIVLEELPAEAWLEKAWTFLRMRFKEWKDQRINEEEKRTKGPNEKYRSRTEMGVTQEAFLKPISNWCFFPVERRYGDNKGSPMRYFLLKIDMACRAVNPFGDAVVKTLVNEVGLPVPSSKFTDISEGYFSHIKPNFDFLKQLASKKDNLNAFIDALIHEHEKCGSCFSRLSEKTAKELLDRIQWDVKYNDKSRRESLKKLPIWKALSGKLKSISSANDVYLTQENIPSEGIDFLEDKHNVVVLLKKLDLERLYEWIGLGTNSISTVYCQFILKYFEDLPSDASNAHLKFLKDKYMVEEKLDQALLAALRKTRIIENVDGQRSFVRDFYDPEIDLFATMLSKRTNFLPEQYSTTDHGWLQFLRYIGLISNVSADLYCKFAKSVSLEEDKQKAKEKSKALVHHLRKSDELREDDSFLDRLSAIPFLFADELDDNLAEIYPVEDDEELLCFQESVKCKCDEVLLAWTVENILPSYASKGLPYEKLKIKCEIPSYSVARNLANVSKSNLLKKIAKGVKRYPEDLSRSFRNVFQAAYRHLINCKDTDTISLLKSIPVILVDKRLISVARKFTQREGFEMSPYMFSMPRAFGQFSEFFQKIGMSDTPTLQQLINVFTDLYAATKEEPLNPNELPIAMKAIHAIITERNANQFPSDITILPLPGALGDEIRLYKSQELVYYDDIHLEGRLTKFNKPRLHLKFTEEGKVSQHDVYQFVDSLPSNLRPKILSEFITEVMLDAETLPNYDFTKELESKLKCREFVQCVLRLMKHQKSDDGKAEKRSLDEVKEQLLRIRVITKDKVQTALFHSDDEVKIEDSEMNKEVFVKDEQTFLNIYIKASLQEEIKAVGSVTKAIISFFGEHFKRPELSPLLQTLLLIDPTTMHEYFDSEGIWRDEEDQQDPVAPSYFRLGEPVPKHLHHLLISDIEQYEVGDCVTYEAEDPGLDDSDEDPVYIYAKICECIREGEQIDFYKIDIGLAEPKVVHKSELYGFHRPQSLEDDEEIPERLEEVKENAKRELEEAFEQGEAYAKKIIKRLWLQWHPDKNKGREEFCTEVFNFVQLQAERLRGHCFQSNHDSFWTFETSYTRYFQRGSAFFRERRSYQSYSYFHFHNTKNPQPREAKRWFRQARCDLDAAKSDLQGRGYEWVCFKCHQAAEKSLKAAVFMKDFGRIDHHFLYAIALRTGNQLLVGLTRQLESLLSSSSHMRYPDRWCPPEIPHDKYNEDKALKALKIAEGIVREVEHIVN
eukprot:gene13906-15355_t